MTVLGYGRLWLYMVSEEEASTAKDMWVFKGVVFGVLVVSGKSEVGGKWLGLDLSMGMGVVNVFVLKMGRVNSEKR